MKIRSLAAFLVVLVFSLVSAPRADAAPQKELDQLVEKLAGDDLAERLVAAQSLAGLGKKAAKATPALIVALGSDQPFLVDACIEALVAVGSKARDPLTRALESGEIDGRPVARGPVARALLRMDPKSRGNVERFIEGLTNAPELYSFLEGLGTDGAVYIVDAAGAKGADCVLGLRSLRRLAAREVREPEVIAKRVEKLKDAELRLALSLAWTQSPTKRDVDVLRGWLRGDRPELAETALWCVGLLGSDATDAAPELKAFLQHDDPTMRATALWAAASLATPGPGDSLQDVPASFPGGSAKSEEIVTEAMGGDVFRLWRDSAKPLGYRGRVSEASRKFWALAPTWTNQVQPVPSAPDRAALSAELLALEPTLIAQLEDGDARTRELASLALAAIGCMDEGVRDRWIGWLSSDDRSLQRAALGGLRPFGRAVIEQEPAIRPLLEHRDTMIPAAQLLTAIATPSGWAAVAERAASIEGRIPFTLLVAMAHYDVVALRPLLPKMTDEYRKGGYAMSALLLRFGEEAGPIFASELGATLADRRMIAAEALGHLGKAALPLLPELKKLKERHPIAQQLLKDAIRRIEG